jgi:hypothetical protein
VRILFGILLCCLAASVAGHEIRPAFLKITELTQEGGNSVFEASFRQPQLNGRFLGLSLATNCQQTNLSASISNGALIELFELDCSAAPLGEIEIDGLDRTLIDTLVSITGLDGVTSNHLITASAGRLDLSADSPSLPVYLSIGIKHLLLGFDHVLFVLMLLYLVRTPIAIVKVITSFTVAHSITLALSAFDIVSLSPAPVEAVIAGSIVLLAYENLRTQKSVSHNFPVIIAFSFGLLHGLGFAGALAEIGLPEGSQIMALLLFNVGIELGQLAIITVVLLLLAAVRIRFSRLAYEAPIYLTGGVASFWFMQRAWLILVPAFS